MNNILDDIRKQCEWVANDNSYVEIQYDQINDYTISNSVNKKIPDFGWDSHWHYMNGVEDTLAYIIALDSINFGSGYFDKLEKRKGENSGYATVAMELKDRFLNKPFTANDLANITTDDCSALFKQELNELMQKFAQALNETGKHIEKYYGGSFTSFVNKAENSVSKLVEQLIAIPHFKDISIYKGRKIPIHKRAQITAGDIYTAFQGSGAGKFDDIAKLTIFADNVVPHVLRYDGLLKYSDDIINTIDAGIELEPETEEEIALRACSIHTVEKIIAELNKNPENKIMPINIDHWLWHRGHEDFYMNKKRHMTKTIFY